MSNDYRRRLAEEMERNPFSTLIDAIYTIVLHDIISYKYVTGDHIKEATLAKEFGVSRSPIRTTINRLAEQGFVVKEKNAAAMVKAFTPQERNDLIQVRRTLEPTAMAYAAQRMTDAEIKILETYMKKLSKACLAGDMLSAFEYENKFHDHIMLCSHNPFIIKEYDALRHYFYQSRMFFTSNHGFYEFYIQEHELLVSVLKLHDKELARAAMIRHLSLLSDSSRPDARANVDAVSCKINSLRSD